LGHLKLNGITYIRFKYFLTEIINVMVKSEMAFVWAFLFYYMKLEAGSQRLEVFEVFGNN
jgi:hypothetical protein